jgi:hypothetical protein
MSSSSLLLYVPLHYLVLLLVVVVVDLNTNVDSTGGRSMVNIALDYLNYSMTLQR